MPSWTVMVSKAEAIAWIWLCWERASALRRNSLTRQSSRRENLSPEGQDFEILCEGEKLVATSRYGHPPTIGTGVAIAIRASHDYFQETESGPTRSARNKWVYLIRWKRRSYISLPGAGLKNGPLCTNRNPC